MKIFLETNMLLKSPYHLKYKKLWFNYIKNRGETHARTDNFREFTE